MPRSARWITVVTLVVMAMALHGMLCSWLWRSTPPDFNNSLDIRILGWFHDNANDGVTGLWARRGVDRGTAIVFGVVVPFGLFATALVLRLTWRHRDRVLGGRCVKCGYVLASPGARCPECGAGKPAT